jgi:hypothetical protein
MIVWFVGVGNHSSGNIHCCPPPPVLFSRFLQQCIFEQLKDAIYEATEKTSFPIVDALFSEMTVLGFLSMVTFIVASEGFITELSVKVFGDSPKGEEYLKELFEQAHYMLFLVMVMFFFIAVSILHMNTQSIEHLRTLRDKVPLLLSELLFAHR